MQTWSIKRAGATDLADLHALFMLIFVALTVPIYFLIRVTHWGPREI